MLAALVLLAGAARVDVSPPRLPVIINCGFLERTASKVIAPLYARSIVLGSGKERIAITVVDSCMMPRELIDRAKAMASQKTGIPTSRMLISATHTHSAPAVMACLGSRAETDYAEFLVGRIAEAIGQAASRMAPARAGWAVTDDHDHTHCRRWIYRADKMPRDPFGGLTVRANMHPGHQNPNAIGPAGPVDPGLTVLSIQTRDGKPLALLANYSQHYFGAEAVSPDYYGLFAQYIVEKVSGGPDFVGILSQGTSGDQQWMDYSQPKPATTMEQYARAVTDVAWGAYGRISYREPLPLAMAETTLRLRRRVPDPARLAWAKDVIAKQQGELPATQQQVYAHEAILLDREPERELKLQAIRIGGLGIAAIPNEVYAITGLKIKAQSPLETTFNIGLANGAEGYIPPPEQHRLGGYTTWPARTAGLETTAEPKIVDVLLTLFEKVAGRSRKPVRAAATDYSRSVMAERPLAYWRMQDIGGVEARNEIGGNIGVYEGGVAYYLPGPHSGSRAVHFAGGRMRAPIAGGVANRAISLWFWNGGGGTLVSAGGELRIDGGRLVWNGTPGKTEVSPKTWMQVTVSRRGDSVRVLLNGREEIASRVSPGIAEEVVFGDGFEGRLSEASITAAHQTSRP